MKNNEMNMIDIVVATKNKDKLKEIKDILKDIQVNVIGQEDGEWDIHDITEDGSSFKENAIKKALTVHKITGKIAIADDSGLEVDILSGQPGIYSARFAGETASDNENNKKLLGLLKEVPFERRTAQFRCVIAIAKDENNIETVEGLCSGIIGLEEKGHSGFGYDPLFIYPDYNKTFAELGSDIKNKVSHRARALEKAKMVLERIVIKSDTVNKLKN